MNSELMAKMLSQGDYRCGQHLGPYGKVIVGYTSPGGLICNSETLVYESIGS